MTYLNIDLKETSDGDLFFTIPNEVLNRLGWKEGDELKFTEKNGSVLIQKINYESVELNFSAEELLKYMTYAHEENITFNELCEKAIRAKLSDGENVEL